MAHLHTTYKPFARVNPNEEGLESLDAKKARIRQELIDAGVTSYGLMKFNSKFLWTIMHDQEHVDAVIYGRIREGPSFLSLVDRMVVATDRRIISINHKPGYTDLDEFTYDIVDGVQESSVGPFSAVTLDSKVGPITLRYVNRRCAEKFVHYIEKRRLEYYAIKLNTPYFPMNKDDE